MVQVYYHNNINYDANGDMNLSPTSCTGKIQLNGDCTIEVEHSFDKEGRWKSLINDNVISCPTPWSDKQLFRIYNREKKGTSIIAYARHIFFDLKNYPLFSILIQNKNGQEALTYLLKDTPFSITSDIPTLNNLEDENKNVLTMLTGDNSFLKIWGGELYLNNYNIIINRKLGGDYGVRAEFGYNLDDIEEDVNDDDVVTRIIPIGANGIKLNGSSPWVDSPNINKYANIIHRFITFDDIKVKDSINDTEGYDTLELAQAEMINRCNKLFEGGIDTPSVNYKVSMALLRNTTEYKGYEVLEDVGLGDIVTCRHYGIDIDIKARCISLEWEVDLDSDVARTLTIELGNAVANYFDNQSDITNRVSNILNGNGSVKADAIEGTINALQTKFKALKSIAQTQHVRAMLFEDLDSNSPTFGAMCIGTMGFEIASERTSDGKDWNWRTFGTGKGFFADQIVAGILTAVLIQSVDGKSFWNLKTGEMFLNKGLISGNGSSWNLDTGEFKTHGNNGKIDLDILISQGQITSNTWMDILTKDGLSIGKSDSTSFIIFLQDVIALNATNINFGGDASLVNAIVSGNIAVNGNLSVNGNKNCLQKTENFGQVPFYANEDVNSLLTYTSIENIYTTELQSDGTYTCKIDIQNVIQECINTKLEYNVWITKLGRGDVWVESTEPSFFIIQSDKEVSFKYKLEGKRKNFEDMTLERHLKSLESEVTV